MVSPASPAWAAVSWPNDRARRRSVAVGGYSSTAVLAGLTGAVTWHVGLLRAGAWAARGLRVPARNALLADIAPPGAYGRAYGFERAMDNLGAIAGPLLALDAGLGPLLAGIAAFEVGNVAATLLILRATELLGSGRGHDQATQLALSLYIAYNVAASVASIPPASSVTATDRRGSSLSESGSSLSPTPHRRPGPTVS